MSAGDGIPDDGLLRLWRAVKGSKQAGPFVRGNAIPEAWARDPYAYGPSLGPEIDEPGGTKIQVFVLKAIRWLGGNDTEDVMT